MIETPFVNIQIDEDALEQQVLKQIEEKMREIGYDRIFYSLDDLMQITSFSKGHILNTFFNDLRFKQIRRKVEYGSTVCYTNSVCNCSPLILKGLKENMAIEKLKEKGIIVAYRANVYYKGKRYTGTRRQSKKEAELDELEQKRDLLTGNHLEESQKTLD